jgi:hypothetical protein
MSASLEAYLVKLYLDRDARDLPRRAPAGSADATRRGRWSRLRAWWQRRRAAGARRPEPG